MVKRQTSNPEREQPIATSGATDAVEVRVTDESSGAAADISSDNTAFVATAPIIVKQEETKDTDFTKETGSVTANFLRLYVCIDDFKITCIIFSH